MIYPSPALLVMACALVAGVWTICRPRESNALYAFLFSLFSLLFGITALVALGAANRAFPLKFDWYLYLIDKALGVSPAFPAARLVRGHLWIVLRLVYDSLPAVTIIWYWINLNRQNGRVAFTAFAVNLLLGSCLYLIVPACGPGFAFDHRFPLEPFGAAVHLIRVDASPNAIPSLHVSSAILFVLLAGRNIVARSFAWLYLPATAAATMVLGEHYLIDLVLAVPFACFAVLLAERQTKWALGNLAVVLAWLISIRFATPLLIGHPNLLRAGAAATVATALIILERGRRLPTGRAEPLQVSVFSELSAT